MRVVLAEGDAPARRLAAAALASRGYRVELAADGEEAGALLAELGAPTVAVLDWQLPGPSVPELCRRLRSRAPVAPLHLLLLTPQDDHQAAWEAVKLGANDYLPRPYQAQELQVRVEAGARKLAAEVQRAGAEELLEALELTRKLCHDLNQPLQIASFSAEMLLEETDAARQQQVLTRLQEALDRATAVSRSISQTARGAAADYLARGPLPPRQSSSRAA